MENQNFRMERGLAISKSEGLCEALDAICDPCFNIGILSFAVSRWGYTGGARGDLCADHLAEAKRITSAKDGKAKFEAWLSEGSRSVKSSEYLTWPVKLAKKQKVVGQ